MPPNQQRTNSTAGRLAQLLGETIVHHAPWTSEISEQTRRRITDEWLENLESHTTGIVGDLVDAITNSSDAPPEILKMLAAAKDPSAQYGSIVQQFFVYGVMFTLAQTLLAPFVQEAQNDVWSANPDRPVPPADIATAVVRGIGLGDSSGVDVPDWSIAEAAKSGLGPDVFKTLVGTSGLAPNLQLLFEGIRRGLITEDQLTEGIKESDVKDKWIPFVSQLRYVQPTFTDFVAAAVRNQMPYADAEAWAYKVGLEPPGFVEDNPDWFSLLYDTAGRPPGTIELLDLAKRGFIPYDGTGPEVLSIEQAVSESDIKNKWFPAIKDLAIYYPPNEEIKTLLMRGAITEDQAKALWEANGVPTEIADAYLYVATTEQITQDKALAKGDIEQLVVNGFITDDQAKSLLMRIGYTGANADWLIQMAHFRYELEALRAGIRQVSSLYTKRKITETEAKAALEAFGLPEANVASLLEVMTAERTNNVQIATASQITTAAYYDIIDQGTALAALEHLGYDAWDAWLVLSARLHTAAGTEPPRPSTFA